MHSMTRRQALAAGASALVLGSGHRAQAQGKPKLRFSAAFPETDPGRNSNLRFPEQ